MRDNSELFVKFNEGNDQSPESLRDKVMFEVLLDIRELLKNQTSLMSPGNKE